MTDGTSQGLFIVVAIVIFGIFTLMAYILFEDTLSPALANMFTEATEQSANSLESDNLYNSSKVVFSGVPENKQTVKRNGDITFSNQENNTLSGINISTDVFKAKTNYKLTFKTKKVSGDILKLGGHLTFSENVKILVDGVIVASNTTTIDTYRNNAWYQGIDYPNDNEEHEITIYFDTNYLGRPESFEFTEESYITIYLQPNRLSVFRMYTLDVTDIYLKEV